MRKRIIIAPLLISSAIALTGCSVVTAPLNGILHKSDSGEVDSDTLEEETDGPESDIFGDEIVTEETEYTENTEDDSYVSEESSNYSNATDYYYEQGGTYGDEPVKETQSQEEENSKPLYSAEYYFRQISDMELPEGATADEDGNIHYQGYRLLKCQRDMLPSTAVVGAGINYEIYVTALPEDEKSSGDEEIIEEDDGTNTSNAIGVVNDGINRVRNAVEDAAKIKENVAAEAGSYQTIAQEAAQGKSGTNSKTEETQAQTFTPTIPDEDPEYEGRLVSVERNSISGQG